MTTPNPEKQPLTALVNREAPLDPAQYEARGGWRGIRRALSMSPDDVIEEVKNSKLRGRGGAGFNTGLKWSFVPKEPAKDRLKYVVANGDEMEPGTFKDRILVEGNPLQLIEGMMITGHAIQADHGIIFLRGNIIWGLSGCRKRSFRRGRPGGSGRIFRAPDLILIFTSIPVAGVIFAVRRRR
ncbi:hypothetical protein CGLAMM_04295 [Acetobacteraceae bacterium EV16G]